MSTTPESCVARRKDHRGGKILSLGILWVAIAIFAVLVVVGLLASLSGGSAQQYDRDVVAVTSNKKVLQPVSPKIVASDNSSFITETLVYSKDYTSVWAKLEKLAPSGAPVEERKKAIAAFLDGLDYSMTEYGGPIVSKSSGNPISPSTLSCYLNGYIPDKPYLKANCPAY